MFNKQNGKRIVVSTKVKESTFLCNKEAIVTIVNGIVFLISNANKQ